MADATSDASQVTLELHGFLARRLEALGQPRGSRVLIAVSAEPGEPVGSLLERMVRADERFGLLYEPKAARLPEHVEVVLNQRVIELQGGLGARLKPGDVLAFLPAHAGGASGFLSREARASPSTSW